MRLPLVWKLVVINIVSTLLMVTVIDVALRVFAADYFMTLAREHHIAPDKANAMFLAAVERYLLTASAVACLSATALSYWLTRRSLEPLMDVMAGARAIAAGDFKVRVRESDCSEVGDLARTFNRMIDSLATSESQRKEMVANVAHELRTPLTNIRGYLEALMESVVEPNQEVFASLHDEALRLVSLTENLLDLARVDSAQQRLQLEPVRLAELIQQKLKLYDIKFSNKQIRLERSLQAAETEVMADHDKLVQVLLNLFENAWRYTPPGGYVRVESLLDSGFVRVQTANTWAGPTRRDNSRIFERFYREEGSRSRDFGGAGLGLSIVKMIVETHGGSVGSDAGGGELRVWFRWPLLQSPP